MNEILPIAEKMIAELKNTSSVLKKKEILAKYPECKELLFWTYDSLKNYYVTAENIQKQRKSLQSSGPNLLGGGIPKGKITTASGFATPTDLVDLLTLLDDRKVTGTAAIRLIVAFLNKNKSHEELILNILDRDLKCRVDASLINKVWPGLIPVFKVALANSYWDHQDVVDFGKDKWFASRKIDGMRLLTIIDEKGDITCFSRNGKELTSLDRIKEDIKETWPDWKNVVFDGEICIVDEDGNEHFDWAMKEVTRKNYTVANPRYQVFDIIPLEPFGRCEWETAFGKRYDYLLEIFHPEINEKVPRLITLLQQTPVKDAAHFEALFAEATAKEWEGLILRKDAPYLGKRSNDMLKVKSFHDAEYVVERIIEGPFRYIKDGKETEEVMLAAVSVTHKGNNVNVGSGFTIAQRQEFYKDPSKIVGKTITVKYFEETDVEGVKSLRFPIIKHIYEGDREV